MDKFAQTSHASVPPEGAICCTDQSCRCAAREGDLFHAGVPPEGAMCCTDQSCRCPPEEAICCIARPVTFSLVEVDNSGISLNSCEIHSALQIVSDSSLILIIDLDG